MILVGISPQIIPQTAHLRFFFQESTHTFSEITPKFFLPKVFLSKVMLKNDNIRKFQVVSNCIFTTLVYCVSISISYFGCHGQTWGRLYFVLSTRTYQHRVFRQLLNITQKLNSFWKSCYTLNISYLNFSKADHTKTAQKPKFLVWQTCFWFQSYGSAPWVSKRFQGALRAF